MGHDVERFVGVVDNELLCRICALVLQDPVETSCEHYFCKRCITSWLAVKEDCPIDRQPLEAEDLMQTNRLIRNLLDRLKIKCYFEKNGCNKVVELENLLNHRFACNYNPETEIICNNGCNLQIRRRDQTTHCADHFKNKIRGKDEEISRLSDTLIDQRTKNDKLNERLVRLNDTVSLQRDEIERLEDEKMNILAPYSKVRLLMNGDKTIAWQIFQNMKMHQNVGVLENDDKSMEGIAQLAYHLKPCHPYFSVCVMSGGRMIGMGLAASVSSRGSIFEKSMIYVSDGTVRVNGKIVSSGERWEEGDYIGCDIQFPAIGPKDSWFHSNAMDLKVNFCKNNKVVVTISPIELTEWFPFVWVG